MIQFRQFSIKLTDDQSDQEDAQIRDMLKPKEVNDSEIDLMLSQSAPMVESKTEEEIKNEQPE